MRIHQSVNRAKRRRVALSEMSGARRSVLLAQSPTIMQHVPVDVLSLHLGPDQRVAEITRVVAPTPYVV